mmetsp:Transcript_15105/g.19149  ORF Transcript_15105/g.19149 Transcript_15105/m.19149 type:complete len:500 (-) Transcript_15105:118-1617(-)|eukprot:CAMPEP_0203691272 /NCGR_PEP_ID=MMETSP0091-20130426/3602_1 /ASSEMBLY_ACC=CAM_ASM_001089 /TAXON_ID=426623 /ORGANISM="Chaetoceros affinis, Strain CCMP159" /LENGTH=499 /DNA_ID=CAMNT_0050561721 /DNA_START=37 /DNA_END=1536 /DNA_ORIENTATION=+
MEEPTAEGPATIKECPFPVKCCGSNKRLRLLVDDATGFQYFRLGNGAVIMSNVFLSRSLIELARIAAEANCENAENEDECDGKIYGFKPSSLITNIATIAGLLAAFLLPVVGAIVDYTDHRKVLGATTAALLIAIQAVQIYTVQDTWFVMAILQAINSFFYQVLTLTAYAYLPEIKQAVGESTMITYSSQFYSWMFVSQVVYLVGITAVGFVLENDDVVTAHIGQAVDVAWSGPFYLLAFYFFTKQAAMRKLPEGRSLTFEGFRQVLSTSKGIFQHYPKTLGFFLLGILFGEAAANSFTVVAVTFLVEYDYNTTETGIVILILLVFCTVGTFVASFSMRKLGSPAKSMQLQLIMFIIVNFVVFPLIPKVKVLVYLAGALWGLMLGWFYPTELQLYASLMPKGQEAELAGFYLYCTQVLGWLPPLIFTIMNENDVELYWGGVHLNIYFFIALVFYSFLPPWEECISITEGENQMVKTRKERESVLISSKNNNGVEDNDAN